MQTILEYLSTKVKLTGVSLPESPNPIEFISFLKYNGFTEIHTDGIDPEESEPYYLIADKEGIQGPIFVDIYDNYTGDHYIAFHDKGNITKENPVFFCIMTEKCQDIEYSYYLEWTKPHTDNDIDWITLKSYKEFREKAIEKFRWKL